VDSFSGRHSLVSGIDPSIGVQVSHVFPKISLIVWSLESFIIEHLLQCFPILIIYTPVKGPFTFGRKRFSPGRFFEEDERKGFFAYAETKWGQDKKKGPAAIG
jgi:hypothetical protein